MFFNAFHKNPTNNPCRICKTVIIGIYPPSGLTIKNPSRSYNPNTIPPINGPNTIAGNLKNGPLNDIRIAGAPIIGRKNENDLMIKAIAKKTEPATNPNVFLLLLIIYLRPHINIYLLHKSNQLPFDEKGS